VSVYWIAERFPVTKSSARRLGFVTIQQMVNALVWAVENPPDQIHVIDVPRIRKITLN
jgi:hypothetical protein